MQTAPIVNPSRQWCRTVIYPVVQIMKNFLPYIVGAIIAGTLVVVPEAKPIACGLGFTIPFLGK